MEVLFRVKQSEVEPWYSYVETSIKWSGAMAVLGRV